MILDCHTHTRLGQSDGSDHLAAVEKVDACLVLADCATESGQVNERLSQYVGGHRDKMIAFALVEPVHDGVAEKDLAVLRDKLSFGGIVVYCATCGFHPAHTRAMRLYESAELAGLPVFFHNGGPFESSAVLDYAQPYLLDEVARQFPALKIIIGNMGQPFIEQTLSLAAKHINVYADLTIQPTRVWQVYNIVISAHERGVMDKLLFGSGYPDGSPGPCIEALLGFNKLIADTKLPTVPRGSIRNIIERDSLELLGIRDKLSEA